MKETEEETLQRVKDETSQKYYKNDWLQFLCYINWEGASVPDEIINEIAKRYHSERLKQLIPTEEESKIEEGKRWIKATSFYENGINPLAFNKGWGVCFKWVIDKLKEEKS